MHSGDQCTRLACASNPWAHTEKEHAPPTGGVRRNILDEAREIVYDGERQQEYGHPKEHFARTIGMINAAFAGRAHKAFTVADWPVIMMLDKIARLMNGYKRDTVRDIAGYAATLARVVGEDE